MYSKTADIPKYIPIVTLQNVANPHWNGKVLLFNESIKYKVKFKIINNIPTQRIAYPHGFRLLWYFSIKKLDPALTHIWQSVSNKMTIEVEITNALILWPLLFMILIQNDVHVIILHITWTMKTRKWLHEAKYFGIQSLPTCWRFREPNLYIIPFNTVKLRNERISHTHLGFDFSRWYLL